MKRFGPTLSLFRFLLAGMPWVLWLFIGIYFVASGAHLPELYLARSIGRAFAGYLVVLYAYLIGNQFFGVSRAFGPKTGKFGLPCAEFILTRPFERRQLSRFYCGLYLGIILLPVLVTGALMLRESDLPLLLGSKNRAADMLGDVFDQVSDYEAQFPGSSIQSLPEGGEKVLLIPHGRLLAVGWELGVLLIVSCETLLKFRAKLGQRWRKLEFGPLTVALMLIGLAAQFRLTNAWPDQILYFFCHHWPWFAFGVAAYIAGAWRLITRDEAEMEL